MYLERRATKVVMVSFTRLTIAASIAALFFLATGTAAEARNFEDNHCGKLVIEYVFPKYFTPSHNPCDGGPCDSKGHYFVADDDYMSSTNFRRVDRNIRVRKSKIFYKGQKCREFTNEEYNEKAHQ